MPGSAAARSRPSDADASGSLKQNHAPLDGWNYDEECG
jgi:hypothetical protein